MVTNLNEGGDTQIVNEYDPNVGIAGVIPEFTSVRTPKDDPVETQDETDVEEDKVDKSGTEEADSKYTPPVADATVLQEGYQELLKSSATDPSQLVEEADVKRINRTGAQFVDPSLGDAGDVTKAKTATVHATAQAKPAQQVEAQTVETATSEDKIGEVVAGTEAAQGEVSQEAQVDAATADPTQMAALGLDAAQAGYTTVSPAAARTLQSGELLSGSAVDMAEVQAHADVVAAQADPSRQATVQGQLEDLYQDFDETDPPAWAAGAMRMANAEMQRRGLGASSIAGMAIVQAAMESAMPIAQQDAKTYAQFEQQNLSNRQQAALVSAQQRATFLGQKFDQEFQTRVTNAARIADIANMNFTAEQQIALENARLAQSVNLGNLNAANAKVLADAAGMSQMDLANLSNEQQAAVENAKNFLAMDMANLDNLQQTTLFNSQSMQQAILSDTAATNATRQFNASSITQTDQFMASLASQISQFNVTQRNAMKQFNVSEKNAMNEFNANLEAQREQFNTTNAVLIKQANAAWRQSAATIDTAAINESNMFEAKAATEISMAVLDALWQRERDLMDYSFTATENVKDRALQLFLGDKQLQAAREARKAEEQGAMVESIFKLLSL